jgi:two-component system invasion response regulator UvrY
MNKTAILIAEDHVLVREAWITILHSEPEFQVVAETGSGQQAIELAEQLKPHIVLMDINLPGMDGIQATRRIREVSPQSGIVVISMHTNPVYAQQVMKMGAMAYICKYSPITEMLQAIADVSHGKKYICREIKNVLSEKILLGSMSKLEHLSYRELEVIELVKQGQTTREIAETLQITPRTVEVHRHNILKKLNLKNFSAVVNFINRTM